MTNLSRDELVFWSKSVKALYTSKTCPKFNIYCSEYNQFITVQLSDH